ncbi:MAG: toll/interleukin-1 receptor domain-containing protein [Rhodospirillales bacterium]|nr:toll/interleukin-1 receptor domain-containing protein [Rhodospirillales bacterium]
MSTPSYRFDFALSFAGPDRELAEHIRDALKARGFAVFYDRDYEHEMIGRDGSLYLRNVYSQEARHCMVLISQQYDARDWTQLERESIQARELRGERGILIPVLVDGHTPAWLSATRIYFDLRSRQLGELIDLLARLRETRADATDAALESDVRDVCTAIRVQGAEMATHCRAHLAMALQDGFVRLYFEKTVTKTMAAKLLTDYRALRMLEDRPTGKRSAKYEITAIGIQVLHRLRSGIWGTDSRSSLPPTEKNSGG